MISDIPTVNRLVGKFQFTDGDTSEYTFTPCWSSWYTDITTGPQLVSAESSGNQVRLLRQ